MPIGDDFRTEKELSLLGESLNETIDLFINDDQLKIKKRGFVIFIVDYATGLAQMNTSCNLDDVTEMMRHWVAQMDESKKKIIS